LRLSARPRTARRHLLAAARVPAADDPECPKIGLHLSAWFGPRGGKLHPPGRLSAQHDQARHRLRARAQTADAATPRRQAKAEACRLMRDLK
jgi:hypothetical protein